jgi:hypothetical protein
MNMGLSAPDDASYCESTGYTAGRREVVLLGPVSAGAGRMTQLKFALRSKGVSGTNIPSIKAYLALDDEAITSEKTARIESAAFMDWQLVWTEDDLLPGWLLLDGERWNAAAERALYVVPVSDAVAQPGVQYQQD